MHLVAEAAKKAEFVILLLGSSGRPRNNKNPFTFEERAEIFSTWAALQGGGLKDRLYVLPLRDFMYNNNHWIHQVQQKVKHARDLAELEHGCTINEVRLTGSDRDSTTWYLHAFPQWHTNFLPPFTMPGNSDVNATAIRAALFNDQSVGLETLHEITVDFLVNFRSTDEFKTLKAEYDFMREYMRPYATLHHPPTFQTVDAVIVQSGHTLMVKRANLPGFGLWALPGGHLNVDEWIRDAIVRESIEETGICFGTGSRAREYTEEFMKSRIRELKTFDHPERSLRKRSITTAGYIRLDDTKALPHVTGQNMPLYETGGVIIPETSKAAWIPNVLLPSMMNEIFEDHLDIIEDLQGAIYGVV
jgi:bifunctional NMN adenylyltransferase/nudix hydrolase